MRIHDARAIAEGASGRNGGFALAGGAARYDVARETYGATQAGMGSAIVTSLRMTGMIFGLAALTSWGLAYFKQLVSQYPSLPLNPTGDQATQWAKGYATHVIASAHGVYSAIFFTTMILCLIAIIPAVFLWSSKSVAIAEEAEIEQTLPPDPFAPVAPATPTEPTQEISAPLAGTFLANAELLDTVDPIIAPPVPPIIDNGGGGGSGSRF